MEPCNTEKTIFNKYKDTQDKIKNSFSHIRTDLKEMDKRIETMRDYIKKEDKKNKYARKQDKKIREEFRRDVDEFTTKITQLKIALSTVNSLKSEYVIRKDLAQIEDKIKTSFKNELDRYKDKVENQKTTIKDLEKRLKKLEKDLPTEKKIGSWFSKNNNP